MYVPAVVSSNIKVPPALSAMVTIAPLTGGKTLLLLNCTVFKIFTFAMLLLVTIPSITSCGATFFKSTSIILVQPVIEAATSIKVVNFFII